ncbi:MAG: PEGA domain-containing protein [Rhodothermaceae bacterium]|nr:PEGA domain-containing protein [Rhodothermaceae bacterium]MYF64045.1 PEGA domain-containing protein [Rhodothermaceae bacterium]MYI84986.1 PEGA domain-containing protein [Rhodothermaceae bacterium]
MKHSLAVFTLLILVGCGTLFIPSTKDVTINSTPTEANVSINGNPHGTTPVTVELDNKTSHTIVISKEGYDTVSCVLNAKVKGSIIVLDVLGGLYPVIIDAITGGWRALDKTDCTVQLTEQ